MTHRWLVLAAMLALAGIAGAQVEKPRGRGMPEDIGGVPGAEAWKEDAWTLPPWPKEASLAEFMPRGSSPNKYYIDLDSISLGADRVVRYTAVVRSRSGASNVSYEGLRCKDAHYKLFALGTNEGTWSPVRDPQWQAIAYGGFRSSLRRDYLCDVEAVAGRNAADLRRRIKSNFEPAAR
jgi:hypothetical protein